MKKDDPKSNKHFENFIVDAGFNDVVRKVRKGVSEMSGSGITLTNNETKDIIKVIKSVKNR